MSRKESTPNITSTECNRLTSWKYPHLFKSEIICPIEMNHFYDHTFDGQEVCSELNVLVRLVNVIGPNRHR